MIAERSIVGSEGGIESGYKTPENLSMSAMKRRALAIYLSTLWEEAISQKGSGPGGWWHDVEAMYRCEPPGGDAGFAIGADGTITQKPTKEDEKTGVQEFRLPQILHSRANAVVGHLSTVITSQLRYCTLTYGTSSEVARKKEVVNHRLWQDGGFEQACREAALNAVLLNRPVWRIYPVYPDQYSARAGVGVEAIHPSYFGQLPLAATDPKDVQLCGHEKRIRIRRVKTLMKQGTYFDISGVLTPSAPSENDPTGIYAYGKSTLSSTSSENDANLTRLAVGQVRLDLDAWGEDGLPTGEVGTERWYRFVLAADAKELLVLHEYPFTYPEYFTGYLMPDVAKLSGGMSLGRMLYSIQDAVNKNVSTFFEMGQRAAMPPTYGPEPTTGSKHTTPPAGAYVIIDEPTNPWAPNITPQLQPLIEFVVHAERWADQVARVSQNTLGTISGRQTTATTDSIIAAGVQTGQQEFLSNFTLPFGEMAQHTCELAASMYDDLRNYYGPLAVSDETPENPDITADQLRQRGTWAATGKKPNGTPSQKLADAFMLLEAAQDPEFGFDKWAVGNIIAENSALAGTQVQKSRQTMQEEIQRQAQAQIDAEDRQFQREMEREIALKRVDAEIAEEKAHNDAQRTVLTDAVKGVVANERSKDNEGNVSRTPSKRKR